MKIKSSAWLVSLALVGAVGLSGCATQATSRRR